MRAAYLGILLIALSQSSSAAIDLCTRFDPSQNKVFQDGFLLNTMVVSRANTKLSGTFTHKYETGKNAGKVKTATFSGICTGNQLSISWQGSYRGQVSGLLACVNSVYNLINVIAVIDGVSSYINVMTSTPINGPCPT